LALLDKRYQFAASDNLIIKHQAQVQHRGGSDPYPNED